MTVAFLEVLVCALGMTSKERVEPKAQQQDLDDEDWNGAVVGEALKQSQYELMVDRSC